MNKSLINLFSWLAFALLLTPLFVHAQAISTPRNTQGLNYNYRYCQGSSCQFQATFITYQLQGSASYGYGLDALMKMTMFLDQAGMKNQAGVKGGRIVAGESFTVPIKASGEIFGNAGYFTDSPPIRFLSGGQVQATTTGLQQCGFDPRSKVDTSGYEIGACSPRSNYAPVVGTWRDLYAVTRSNGEAAPYISCRSNVEGTLATCQTNKDYSGRYYVTTGRSVDRFTWYSTPVMAVCDASNCNYLAQLYNYGFLNPFPGTFQTSMAVTVEAPAPTPITCTPQSQNTTPGAAVSFTTSGGSAANWTATGGSPVSGQGATFTTSFATAGTKVVEVAAGGALATCTVIVTPPPQPLACAPGSQSATAGAPVAFSSNGSASTKWTATGGSPTAGTGKNFSTAYASPGTYDVLLTDAGAQGSKCVVTVVPAITTTHCSDGLDNDRDGLIDCADPACWTDRTNPQSCDPKRTTEFMQCNDGLDNDFDGLVDARDPGCHTDGNAANSASFDPNDNDEFNTVAGGGLACSPPTQQNTPGKTVKFASNGTAAAAWSAPGGSPSSGTGNNFSTKYSSLGSKTVTVREGSASAQCLVSISSTPPKPQCSDGIDNDGDGLIDAADPGCHVDNDINKAYDPNDNDEFNAVVVGGMTCAPSSQQNTQGETAQFTSNGTAAATWSAPGGTPASGTGNNFSTQYSSAGNKTVTVRDSNGSAQCLVTVVPTITPPPKPQCSDGIDNDGDGLIDAADPGCHVDNDINKAYDPNDNSEAHVPPFDPNGFQETD